MKERVVQKDYLRLLKSFKKRVFSEFVWLESRDLCKLMSQLGHYHYNKKKIIILGENRDLYNFLINNNYHPFTIYRWLLLEMIPEDIKYQIKEGKLSQRKAISVAFRRRQETAQTISANVQELGLALIRGM